MCRKICTSLLHLFLGMRLLGTLPKKLYERVDEIKLVNNAAAIMLIVTLLHPAQFLKRY